jgi:hypothetical protein
MVGKLGIEKPGTARPRALNLRLYRYEGPIFYNTNILFSA